MQNRVVRAGDPEIFRDGELREHALDLQRALDAEPADLVRLEAGDVAAVKEHAAAVGGSSPETRLKNVVLPAPFGPMMACSRPPARLS